MHAPITHVHWFFGGFTQRLCRAGNGVYSLYEHVYRSCASPATLVAYHPWYLRASILAECLVRLNEECFAATEQPLRIAVAGYSFGGGTAVQLAQALVGSGVRIDRMTLCDAVGRRFGRLGWLRAANPWTTLYVPATVRRLTWLRQRNPRWQLRPPFFWPAGHDVVAAQGVQVEGPVELEVDHLQADNAPAFANRVYLDVAGLHRHDRDYSEAA